MKQGFITSLKASLLQRKVFENAHLKESLLSALSFINLSKTSITNFLIFQQYSWQQY